MHVDKILTIFDHPPTSRGDAWALLTNYLVLTYVCLRGHSWTYLPFHQNMIAMLFKTLSIIYAHWLWISKIYIKFSRTTLKFIVTRLRKHEEFREKNPQINLMSIASSVSQGTGVKYELLKFCYYWNMTWKIVSPVSPHIGVRLKG